MVEERKSDPFDDPTFMPDVWPSGGRSNPLAPRDRQREMELRYRDLNTLQALLGKNYHEPKFMAELKDAMGVTGLAAELVKKDRTTKAIHEQLNALGIPDKTTQGVGICLEGRIARLISRLAK